VEQPAIERRQLLIPPQNSLVEMEHTMWLLHKRRFSHSFQETSTAITSNSRPWRMSVDG
jgi:hypothetical protein